ncbi:hypothetical protein [Paenibacillus sp. Soil750]|uniref:hypothetical protein n=1 Tax=Paenibacillus sp. Soil750 TaxID=1736398 RepID=UPI000A4DA259|nr:hypothetical protein [Paenibacillus sp. Soil750]
MDQHVLFGVEFITNGGDIYPSLDKTGGVIEEVSIFNWCKKQQDETAFDLHK